MTGVDLVQPLSLEDLQDAIARLEAAAARGLVSAAEGVILLAEIQAQIRDAERRRREPLA